MRLFVIIVIWMASPTLVAAEETRVAVAANFTQAAREIGQAFEKESGHKVIFSFGSTGQLYAQISQYAPYDVFLSADQLRVEKAIDEGYGEAKSRFTYARGRIALYSPDDTLIENENSLHEKNFTRIAIANPVTAPYGQAALDVIEQLGLYQQLKDRIVQGNNIAQAYQFVHTGNAELGFVALSQIIDNDEGSRWIIPEAFYDTLSQDAVLLKTGADNKAAKAFLDFLQGSIARTILERHGYHG